MSLEAGTQLGDYRIVEKIGAGAYGEVYEAEHLMTHRRDALKVLLDGRMHIPEEEQRFLREIQVQASLQHPNIAAVYHAFTTAHGPVLVMELVRGEALSKVLLRGRIPLDRGVKLILEVLAGLSYAHAKRVVHRDVKPENIIVAPDWSLKLTDFGLARSQTSPRLSQAGVFAGSPFYMAPEQAHATKPADARSDTYSAGVVLYEILTGRVPFTGKSTFDVLTAHQNAQPKPPCELEPGIKPSLERVILKALEKDPRKRYQNAGEFRTAVERAMAPIPQAPRKRSPLLAAGICGALAAAGLGAVVVYENQPAALAKHTPSKHATKPVPAAPAPAAAPASAEAVTEENAEPPAEPPAQPKALVKTARKRPAPPPTALKITGSLGDNAAARPAALRTPPPVAPMPISEPPAACIPGPLAPPAPEAPAATASTDDHAKNATPAKRHNVVVRAIHKVFHTGRESEPPKSNLVK